ncbi:hypothetical protein [Lysobacter antibioticus]|uniref:hypothetical protein n=1 Tax=Lysobacter antibioticus TaxID=84531 RepID=UPI000B1971F2|nr:hypothetical protein [Lysobacter antibioticus]
MAYKSHQGLNMQKWLLSRLFDIKEQPAPRFAFYGTVNWMRALHLCVDVNFEEGALRKHYSGVEVRPINRLADTIVFENIFMAFNHVAGLASILNDVENSYDISRPAIAIWYRTIFSAASAMVVAATGALPSTRDAIADAWQTELANRGLIISPFSLVLSSLISARYQAEVDAYRGGNEFDINSPPRNYEQAWGGIVSYLAGTADYERGRAEILIRETNEFRALEVDNFRTKASQQVRDAYLQNMKVSFLVQARRYAGKANYRDSIFLTYGEDRRDQLDQFLVDLVSVAKAFLRMACTYCSCRVEPGTWDQFVDDVESNSRLSLDALLLRT